MMRKILAGIITLILVVSCSKNSPAGFKGTYTFKTGGTITVVDGRSTIVRHLVTEIGQMHVVQDKGNKMVVTMNISGGDPVVFNAAVEDGRLVLDPLRRTVGVTLDIEALTKLSYTVDVSGEGRKMDNVILFDLKYDGESIVKSDVRCIASKNE